MSEDLDDFERLIARYRPIALPEDVRERIFAGRAARRRREWWLPTAAAAAAVFFYAFAARARDAAAHAITVPAVIETIGPLGAPFDDDPVVRDAVQRTIDLERNVAALRGERNPWTR